MIQLEPPADLRDLVWTPAHFEFVNGGQAVGVIPTRYAGSEGSDDSQVAMGRKTVWHEAMPEVFVGLGQRVLATDSGEHPLMEIRAIVIDGAEKATGAADA
jgi:type VI secretion system protein ImpE